MSLSDEEYRRLRQIFSDPYETELKLIECYSTRIITPEISSMVQAISHVPEEVLHYPCFAALLRLRLEKLCSDNDTDHYERLIATLQKPSHAELHEAVANLSDVEATVWETSDQNSLAYASDTRSPPLANLVSIWLASLFVDYKSLDYKSYRSMAEISYNIWKSISALSKESDYLF